MADGFTENTNEQSLLRWLDTLGWEVYGGPGDSQNGGVLLNDAQDRSVEESVLWNVVQEKLIQLNPKVTPGNVDSAITSIKKDLALGTTLIETNQDVYGTLTGKQVTLPQPQKEPVRRQIQLIDFENPDNNSLIAANQVRFKQDGKTIIPDVTLFINGFPIVQVELKSSGAGNDASNAVRDLQDYENDVPEAFKSVLFNFAADTHNAHVGAVTADSEQYQPWNDAPPEFNFNGNRFKEAAHATLSPGPLLDILENYVFYLEGVGGITKITPRYMQYYATGKILDRIQNGTETRGLIWHTQGSGKTFTMIYTAHQLLEVDWFESPQIIIAVDTDDLREQLTDTLNNIGYSHRFSTAESMEDLFDMIRSGKSGVIVTTIQMFEEAPSGIQNNENTVVLSDEGHRYMEKKLGNRLEGALPTIHHYGFTGTPVSESVRNTFENFSDGTSDDRGRVYLDRYSIKQGIDDEVILPVNKEIRTDISWRMNDIDIDKDFEDLIEDVPDDEVQKVIRDNITRQQLSELAPRVEELSRDIISDYVESIAPNGWKAMVVTPTRESAMRYGEQLRELALWYELDPEDIRVVISEDPDSDESEDYVVDSGDRKQVIKSFKKNDSPKIFVVCDMLLTGFDAPVLKAMYLDRNLKNHNLLQAIARVNRPADGKNNGLIVDYSGALANIDDALDFDDEVIQEYAIADEEELFEEFETMIAELQSLFDSDLSADRQEDVRQLVSEVTQNTDRFKQKVEQLQNVYESLSPHSGLIDYEDEYVRLNKIRLEVEAAEGGPAQVEGTHSELGHETLELVEQHVDIDLLGEEYQTYQLNGDSLDEVADVPPEIEVIHIGKGLQEIIDRRRQQNPRYDQLSERVHNILENWDKDMKSATETLAALEEIEEWTREIEEESDNRNLSSAEYAIYLTLRDEHDDVVPSDDEAELIAKEIEKQFQDTVTRDFLGWKSNPDTYDDIRKAVITALGECNKMTLYSRNGFMESCVQYLIENH